MNRIPDKFISCYVLYLILYYVPSVFISLRLRGYDIALAHPALH